MQSRSRIPVSGILLLLVLVISFSVPAQDPPPADPPPAPAPAVAPPPEPAVEQPGITVNLNRVPIDQLVKFLSDTTGKPVIKQRDIDTQITVFSPTPVTRREALELIYSALQMEGIYVIESEDRLQIVTSLTTAGVEIETIPEDVDIQTFPDSLRLARKTYRLKNVSPENLKLSLSRIVPATVLDLDPRTRSVILTDQVTKLKSYDLAIKALDSIITTDRIFEIFELKYADAVQITILIGNVLTNSQLYEQSGGKHSSTMQGLSNLQTLAAQVRSRSAVSVSTPIVLGDITMVPDPQTNWLIVTAPPERMEEIRKLVAEFDTEQKLDVQIRLIQLTHIDARYIYTSLTELFRDMARTQSQKDTVRIVPNDQGDMLMVFSSEVNYELIKNVVEQLDTEDSTQQVTRTFIVENMEVEDLSMKVQTLYTGSMLGRTTGPASARAGQAKFVPSARSNSLLVLAYPREMPFIEDLVMALDTPAVEGAFEPRIYKIENTDANELLKVLTSIFSGGAARTGSDYYYWRIAGGDKDSLESLYGKVRFVVDAPTNSIIAIAANPSSLEIVGDMIEKLDKLDPEASDILVYELKYADAVEVADQINNLLSDGAVTRPSQTAATASSQANANGTTSTGSTNTYAYTNRRDRDIIYPWQSTQSVQQRSLLERPINRMIGNVRIVPDTRSNKILVTAQPAYLGPLKRILESLDQPEPQVHIATRMVEITRGNDRRIGIRWTPDPSTIDPAELENAFLGLGRLGFVNTRGTNAISPTTVTSETSANSDFGGVKRTITSNLPGGNAIFGADVNLALLIQLLMKNTESRILSEPALTVNNNELGNIFVGSEFPFRVNSQITDQGGSTVGIEYRKVGINLDILPHINTEGEVDMRIALENSKIREGETVDGQIIKDQRMFNTQVAVSSGATMVIGGILLEDSGKIERGVPILGSIPILKYVFGKSDKTKTVRELLVFITPEIISAPEDSDALLERSLEQMRRMEELGSKESIFLPIAPPDPNNDTSRLELILEPQSVEISSDPEALPSRIETEPADGTSLVTPEGDIPLPAAPEPEQNLIPAEANP